MPYAGDAVQDTLVGIFLEVLLTGAFFIVSMDCVKALHYRWKTGNAHWYMIGTFCLLWLFITIRTLTDMVRTVKSFTHPSEIGAIDLGAPASTESLMTNLMLVLITATADFFLVYRVYIVWKRSILVALLPLLLVLGGLGTGAYVMWCFVNAVPKNGIAAYLRIGPAFSYWCYTTLSANVLGTVLIASRIWWIRRQSKGALGSTSDAVSHILTLIVESAFVYSAVLSAEIVAIAKDSYLNFTFINLIGPLVGIVFSYIIIRASSSSSTSRFETSAATGGMSGGGGGGGYGASYGGGPRSAGPRRDDLESRGVDSHPVQIRLETITHSDHPYSTDKYDSSEAYAK
ncbi:hypothetical protein BKA62DRAFT_831782 [Auriculariales sp. MPI-PUGE-AT-0066]|nr:hypothetical protein BKA62DRAFT_831782 [Auriculariales sp. MPI-PUGE-AT-0066]